MTVLDALIILIVSVAGGYCGSILHEILKKLVARWIVGQLAKSNNDSNTY